MQIGKHMLFLRELSAGAASRVPKRRSDGEGGAWRLRPIMSRRPVSGWFPLSAQISSSQAAHIKASDQIRTRPGLICFAVTVLLMMVRAVAVTARSESSRDGRICVRWESSRPGASAIVAGPDLLSMAEGLPLAEYAPLAEFAPPAEG